MLEARGAPKNETPEDVAAVAPEYEALVLWLRELSRR